MFKKFKILNKSIAIILCLAIAISIMPVMPAFAYTSAPKRNWSYYYNNSSVYPINGLMNKIGSSMDKFLDLADARGVTTLYLWGPNWSYTNLTYDKITWPVKVTDWYDSFYGPLLCYLQSLPSSQRLATSIAFSKVKFSSSDRVYIGWNVNDLADAKAVATLQSMRNSGSYALLVTDSYSDPLLQSELKRLNAKHVILLGGSALYDSMEAIGDSYNVIRVGGKDREETLWLAKNMSSSFFAKTKPSYNKGTYTFIDNVGLSSAKTIEQYLARGNFKEAARLVTKTPHGSKQNVVNGTPAVIIGVNDSFLFSYYVTSDLAIVCQYFGPKYPEFPHTPPVPPSASATASANPSSVTFQNKDVSVEININASVSGVDASNISYWRFGAKRSEDSQFITRDIYSAKTSQSGKITVTIPQKAITFNYTQLFNCEVRVYFKNPITVNGTIYRSVKATAITSTKITKPNIEPPSVGVPVADYSINNQSRYDIPEIVLGQEFTLKGLSTSSNGPIVMETANIYKSDDNPSNSSSYQGLVLNMGRSLSYSDIGKKYELSVNLSKYSNRTVYMTANQTGTYIVRFTATDSSGKTSTEVTGAFKVVSPPPMPQPDPVPPVALFSMPATVRQGSSVSVVNSSFDPDGNIVSSSWSVNPSTGVSNNLGNSGGVLSFSLPGTYTVTLTVTDDDGLTDTTSKTINVIALIPPKADFTLPNSAGLNTSVYVANQSYDIDGGSLTSQWTISPSTGVTNNLNSYGGTLSFAVPGTYTVTLKVTDTDGLSDTMTKSITITNQSPKAILNMPTEVYQGEDFTIESNSYDIDGKIAKIEWSVTPSSGMVGNLSGNTNSVYFDTEGTYTVTLKVTDDFGATDQVTQTITVKPAVPTADLQIGGYFKQNRQVELIAKGSSSPVTRYPVLIDQNEWEIQPLTPGVTASDICIRTTSPLDDRLVLFKKPGNYKIRLRVRNAKQVSSWVEKIITIEPDQKPVANFSLDTKVLREPPNNLATINITDMSYSPDGDIIASRIWKYKYDSNNDGNFGDEQWVTIDSSNKEFVSFTTDKLGKYLVELQVQESFGEPTLDEFVTNSDRLISDTSNKPFNEKISEVDNIPPYVSFTVTPKQKADIVFTVGQTDSSKIQDLNSKINSYIKSKLAANNIDVQITSIETNTISSNDVGASTIFNNWQKYPLNNASMFNAGWGLSGNEIYTSANVHWTGFWDNKSQNVRDVEIEFDVMTTQHPDPWGFTFRMRSLAYDTYQFYALEWGPYHKELTLAKITRWVPCSNDPVHGGPLYHGTISAADGYYGDYGGGDRFAGVLRDCQGVVLQSVPFDVQFNRWDHAKIVVKGNRIQVWINGNKYIDYTDTNNPLMEGSYGPYTASQYNTHFKNVKITTGTTKTLDEVLKEPSWRPNASHFLVNISDTQLSELNQDDLAAVILSKLLNNNIDFIALGTSANQAQYQELIAKNSGNGVFYDNSNMDIALDNLGTYILNKVKSKVSQDNSQYVLLGEDLDYQTFYSDFENDPKYQEQWLYTHNANYFENSLGVASYNGQWIPNAITKFDKVGEFDVVFKARDNPVGSDDRFDNYRKWSAVSDSVLKIFVHRKPIAQFMVGLAPNDSEHSVNITDGFEDTSNPFGITGGWRRSTTQKQSGSYSWSNLPIGDGSSISSRFSFNIPSNAVDARLSFDYLVRSEENYDYLNVYLNGQRIVHVSGNGTWQNYQTNLAAGNYTVVFEYAKDGSVSRYDDAGYIDNLTVSYKVNNTTGYNVSLRDTSYDLDHQSEADKGIVEHEWKWKNANDTTWHEGMVNETLAPGQNYIISLRVKDKEGAWSDPYVQFITTKPLNLPPVAQFSVSPNPLPIGKNLVVDDSSYDPNGDPIVERAWVVEKDGTTVYQGSSLPTNYSSYGVGNYKITLKVRDNPGTGVSLWSEPYSQTFQVIPDNRKPIADFAISPTTIALDAGNTIAITDRSSDPDNDPIITWEWQVKKANGTWVSVDTPPTDLEYYGVGTHSIRLRVEDQPRLPQLDPLWSDWVEKSFTVIPGNQKPIARFTVTPNPVPADEPITYNDTSYDPEGKAITERLWTIRCVETGQVYQYSNQNPPTIFEETGWGINGDGVGTYEITLKVKDSSPNGISPARWSDPVTQKLVVEDPLRINSLVMTAIVNPPFGTQAPIVYPVTTPVKVKAGYRMTFSVNTNGGDRLDIKLYANGQPLTVHTDSGDTNTITMATVRKNASTTFSFWTDEDLPAGTVMDMKIILTKIKSDGTEKSIVNNELGERFAVIVGSAKEDSSINLIR